MIRRPRPRMKGFRLRVRSLGVARARVGPSSSRPNLDTTPLTLPVCHSAPHAAVQRQLFVQTASSARAAMSLVLLARTSGRRSRAQKAAAEGSRSPKRASPPVGVAGYWPFDRWSARLAVLRCSRRARLRGRPHAGRGAPDGSSQCTLHVRRRGRRDARRCAPGSDRRARGADRAEVLSQSLGGRASGGHGSS